MSKPKPPREFQVVRRQLDDEMHFELHKLQKSGRYRSIGRCRLSPRRYPPTEKTPHWETHSSLFYQKYHNRGFGLLLYTRAIEWAIVNGGKVVSSNAYSDMAERLWESKRLNKIFDIHRTAQRFKIVKMKKKTIKLRKDSTVEVVSRKKFADKALKKMEFISCPPKKKS